MDDADGLIEVLKILALFYAITTAALWLNERLP